MTVVYSIREDSARLWCIWRAGTYLADRMTLERAIKEAGRMARDHHARTGLVVTVELHVAGEPSLLSRYAKPLLGSESVAA